MKPLAPLLLIWLLIPSSALFTPGERLLVIRIDDVQDYVSFPSYATAQRAVLQYHIDAQVPALLAIVGSRFGTDPQLVDQIRRGLNHGVFTAGLHGWHHEPITNLTKAGQTSQMQYGKNRLEALLGVEVLSFVPPYGKFNRATIDAMKTNGFTLMSSAVFEGDIPREDSGILYIPQSVSTAEVELDSDSWVPLSVDRIVDQITTSWNAYGIAVLVIHPRQFVGAGDSWSTERWDIYMQVIGWIQENQGRIIKAEPPKLVQQSNLNPFLISVATFSGLTSTLLVAFNLSARRGRNKSGKVVIEGSETPPTQVVAVQPVNFPISPHASGLSGIFDRLGLSKARASTKVVLAVGVASCAAWAGLGLMSGKTYLDLGINWLGIGSFGVGFFQGKIFYSSIITFIGTFVMSYFFLVEKQRRHPVVAVVVSGLVVLSAAYIFEYVYLYLNGQVLLKYLSRPHWWFNLLAGLVVGFGFKFMRVNKIAAGLFALFGFTMAVWYLSGYPQLADKETPVLLYTNYTGLPMDWAYAMNAIAKLVGCIATASLLIGGGIRKGFAHAGFQSTLSR